MIWIFKPWHQVQNFYICIVLYMYVWKCIRIVIIVIYYNWKSFYISINKTSNFVGPNSIEPRTDLDRVRTQFVSILFLFIRSPLPISTHPLSSLSSPSPYCSLITVFILIEILTIEGWKWWCYYIELVSKPLHFRSLNFSPALY